MYKKINPSIKDNINIENFIFREYKKKEDKFIATSNFYFSSEFDDGKVAFFSFNNNFLYENIKKNKKMIPYNENLYILKNINEDNQIFFEKYIDLFLISNISFSLEDIYINKSEIIRKFMETDELINEKLFEDLYFNEEFSKKINIELPQKYNDKKIILENIEINKKYLFKINILELNSTFNEENNLY